MMVTREQIEHMPAGKEIERLIAEIVMEWRLIPEEHKAWVKMAWRQLTGPHHMDEPDTMIVIPHDDGTWRYQHPSWFSTDINSIWQLVEKMKPLRLWLVDLGDYWRASFVNEIGNGVTANGETPMLAISRAALIAKLEEEALNKRGDVAVPHPFKGRLDRDCETCGLPDRDPIHKGHRPVLYERGEK